MQNVKSELIKVCAQFDKENNFLELPDFDEYDSPVAEWIMQEIGTPETMGELRSIVSRFQPALPDETAAPMLAIWPDSAARITGPKKRQRGKPGKQLRKMFPFLDNVTIESMATEFKERFFMNGGLRLTISDDDADFVLAYSGAQSPMANPYTTHCRKSLASSCMRYSFDQLGDHPARAYASGDFHIYMVRDDAGLIAARCVVRKPCMKTSHRPVAGPIYGVSESAIDLIESKLESQNAVMFSRDDETWIGARLLRIEYDRGGFIAPYLDRTPQALDDDGDFLIVSPHGEIDASDYGGVLDGGNCINCHECGERVDPEYSYSDDYGREYCECCYSELFGFCEECDETTPRDELQTGYYIDRHGDSESRCVCDHCISQSYTRIDSGDYWRDDDVIHADNGDVISRDEFESDYATCEWTDEIHPWEDMAETDDGERVLRSELEGNESYELRDGIWHMIQPDLFDDESGDDETDDCAPVSVPKTATGYVVPINGSHDSRRVYAARGYDMYGRAYLPPCLTTPPHCPYCVAMGAPVAVLPPFARMARRIGASAPLPPYGAPYRLAYLLTQSDESPVSWFHIRLHGSQMESEQMRRAGSPVDPCPYDDAATRITLRGFNRAMT